MSKQSKDMQKQDQFAFYMDLLGHDILNNNQAVLGYLELVLATPGIDKKTREFAEKGISHVRTSTVLIDNFKRLIAARGIDADKLKPIDLVRSVERAESELKRFFPRKNIKFEMVTRPKGAFVHGNNHAADLILNVFLTAIRLNPSDDITMSISFAEERFEEKRAWVMRAEDKNSQLPPFLDGKGVTATYSQDISTAVRSTGVLFAKMIAGNLGGDFEAHSIHHDPRRRGAVFTVILRRAEKP